MTTKKIPLSERITLSPQEAADTLGVSKPLLQRLIDDGRVPSFMIGTRRLIVRSDLEIWAARERDLQMKKETT